jgi:hypothetical protein
MSPILKKNITKIGLVEWLKMQALSSNPSTMQKKKKEEKKEKEDPCTRCFGKADSLGICTRNHVQRSSRVTDC